MGNLTSSSGPRIPNYKPGKVYLFTFPSVRCCPTISPFALKVESWLRLNGIEYEAIRSYSHWSKKGQVPFVEVDGREINESSFIIKELAAKFNKLDDLTAEQQAVSSMVEAMVDNHLVWSYSHYRMLGPEAPVFFEMWEGMGAVKRAIASRTIPRNYRSRLEGHGIGRNTVEEIHAMGCDDIRALSGLLGDKQFLMGGEAPTAVDCAVFSHLAQIWYSPLKPPHKAVMETEAKNLGPYLDRLKSIIWPDWEEFCAANVQGSEKLPTEDNKEASSDQQE
ncbi:hypothetical protein BOX15_Mlig027273g1 [Macrostomum lignano]|uniref:Glutathione transferase n=1 Tax=Macrostomum lignano TaxID=282301 RepID=A0A267GLN5_9PLAT|nr:hypothetical protein BOX15_Mlig027273g1 [Macrostomum lignano]